MSSEAPASIHDRLSRVFAEAIARVTGLDPAAINPQVRPAGDPKFGDYQCNATMSLARQLGRNPRELATQIKAAADPLLAGAAEPLEVAGPGFLNVRLLPDFLSECLARIPPPPTAASDALDHLDLPRVARPQRVVVEYSQPNIAKQMHVGHLRSTIIGDVFARVLGLLGHDVIRQNHIGDWGTQFGMLIRWYREHPLPRFEADADVLESIEADYRAANERFASDEAFAREARAAVAELQGGDTEARRIWEQICAVSLQAVDETYRRLGVLLRPEDVRGESFYNSRLPAVIEDLRAALPARRPGEASGGWSEVRDDQGAVCVFLYQADGSPRFKGPTGEPLPVIIRKSDGGYLYATTDLAALRYRLHELEFRSGRGAERIIYVTDARQKLHFEMFFAVARDAGWIPPGARVDHVTFGSVLGPDRRPLKTRSGATIKLRDLLDEAESRAAALVAARERSGGDATMPSDEGDASRALSADERQQIASRVGVASIKYADLRNDRNADYLFDWDKMVSLQGNTAPYMMYACARVRSIYRKAAERTDSADPYAPGGPVRITHPAERALALRLLRMGEHVEAVANDLLPHVLCGYLYDLAGDFMKFYESCPVLDAPDAATRLSRLRFCDLTARTLKLGLWLLGIEVLERM